MDMNIFRTLWHEAKTVIDDVSYGIELKYIKEGLRLTVMGIVVAMIFFLGATLAVGVLNLILGCFYITIGYLLFGPEAAEELMEMYVFREWF